MPLCCLKTGQYVNGGYRQKNVNNDLDKGLIVGQEEYPRGNMAAHLGGLDGATLRRSQSVRFGSKNVP